MSMKMKMALAACSLIFVGQSLQASEVNVPKGQLSDASTDSTQPAQPKKPGTACQDISCNGSQSQDDSQDDDSDDTSSDGS